MLGEENMKKEKRIQFVTAFGAHSIYKTCIADWTESTFTEVGPDNGRSVTVESHDKDTC